MRWNNLLKPLFYIGDEKSCFLICWGYNICIILEFSPLHQNRVGDGFLYVFYLAVTCKCFKFGKSKIQIKFKRSKNPFTYSKLWSL